jgi:hypothetical protein
MLNCLFHTFLLFFDAFHMRKLCFTFWLLTQFSQEKTNER